MVTVVVWFLLLSSWSLCCASDVDDENVKKLFVFVAIFGEKVVVVVGVVLMGWVKRRRAVRVRSSNGRSRDLRLDDEDRDHFFFFIMVVDGNVFCSNEKLSEGG